jgi:hypothetical protein
MRWNPLVALLLVLLLTIASNGQNIVSGSLQSIPSRTTPSEARVTFTNTSTQEKYSQLTRDGTFSIDLPSGTYERKFEKVGNYLTLDNVTINSSQTMNMKLIEDTPVQSTVYNNYGGFTILKIMKGLTGTWDPETSVLTRANNIPMRLYARNYSATDPLSMPQSFRAMFDQVLNDIVAKTDGIMSFNEQQTDATTGISSIWPKNADMPNPGGAGYTIADENHATCYYNRELLLTVSNQSGTFAREMLRAMKLQSNGADPSYIMYTARAPLNGFLHPDEGNVIKIMYTLDNYTDMNKYKEDQVVSSIINTAPQQLLITSPINNSTATYTNGNLEINTNNSYKRSRIRFINSKYWSEWINYNTFKKITIKHSIYNRWNNN